MANDFIDNLLLDLNDIQCKMILNALKLVLMYFGFKYFRCFTDVKSVFKCCKKNNCKCIDYGLIF